MKDNRETSLYGQPIGCHRPTLDDVSNKEPVNTEKLKKAVDDYLKLSERVNK